MREHFVVSKGHRVASYSLLAQEQTDTFVKAAFVTVDYFPFSDFFPTFQLVMNEEKEEEDDISFSSETGNMEEPLHEKRKA